MNSQDRIQPVVFDAWPEVISAMSTRRGGETVSAFGMNLSLNVGDDHITVERNRRRFFGPLGIGVHELAIPGQVHSATVRPVHEPGLYPNCDALVTCTPRVFLCVTVADCLPILIFDPDHRALAGVHAGWRGTAAGIAVSSIRTMQELFGTRPQRLFVFIGPGADVCCYQVGDDVAGQVDPRFVVRRHSQTFLDLKGANIAQLHDAGVPSQNVEVHPSCTISEAGRLHSYRRDKQKSGRMMAVIGLSS